MIDSSILKNLETIKSNCLVFDIECSSHYPTGQEINILDFTTYAKYAKVKWVGLYSFLYNKEFLLNAATDTKEIIKLFSEHNTLIGFNSESFDFPILVSNGFIDIEKRYNQIDCMTILGNSTFRNKDGYKFKGRAELMDYKLKSHSLKAIAESMGLETQKGDIDWKIFQKNEWDENETKEIKFYLSKDVSATKEMFLKLWNFWLPFAELLSIEDIYNLSWIKSSIASLTYKSACKILGTSPTYAETTNESESMGGRVIIPKVEESYGIWMCDIGSLYPHIISQCNLNAEISLDNVSNKRKIWHGNEIFQVKGYYDITEQHPLSKYISSKLKERIWLKENDKNNPLIYCLKIFLNSYYGAARSSIFEKIHTPNIGWDTCWIGSQISQLAEEMLNQFGFDVIISDTDSFGLKAREPQFDNKEYVKECLSQIIEVVKDNVPFPLDTFKINIEKRMDYLMVPFSEQPIVGEDGKNLKEKNRLILERVGKKKNYMYIFTNEKGEKDVKLVGLPLIKDNATLLAPKIYNEVLKPEILKQMRAKFPRSYLENILNNYLQKPEALELLSQEYKVNKASSYKNNCIQAQISTGYFNGEEGVIRLIKNTKVGKAGQGMLYCTIKEATDAKLTREELDLDKVNQELSPFVLFEEVKPPVEAIEQAKTATSSPKKAKDEEIPVEPKKSRGKPKKIDIGAKEVSKEKHLGSNQEGVVRVHNFAPNIKQATIINNDPNAPIKFIFKDDTVIGITSGNLTLKIAPSGVVDPMVKKYHYSHKSTKNRFLSFTVNENKGFLQLGYGIRPHLKTKIYKKITPDNFCEFDRMWLSDDLPKFSESQVISLLMKFLKIVYPEIIYVITYADGSVGNVGTIYKATNAFQVGKVHVDFYQLPNGERIHPVTMWHRHKTRAKAKIEVLYPGIKHLTDEFQYRYLYILDKKEWREYKNTHLDNNL